MNKGLKLASISGVALILMGVTVAVFFLGTQTPRMALDFMALAFALVSEAAICCYLLFLVTSRSSSGKRIIHSGILSSLAIYWVLTILLAFFREFFVEKPNNFTIVNLILLGVTAILCIAINAFASYVQASEKGKVIDKQGKRGSY